MGTKHGYTEKRCNVCGKVKKRDEYPKRGGLTCKDCQNKQRRGKHPEATPERREQVKLSMRALRARRKRGEQ